MKNQWKPSETIVTTLEECGVDRQILDDLLQEAMNSSTLSTPALFVTTAVSQQLAWSSSFDTASVIDEHLTATIPSPTRMKKAWRPSPSTFKLLINELGIVDKVELHWVRAYFVREYQGQVHRHWDVLFVDYTLQFYEAAKATEAELEQPVSEVEIGVSLSAEEITANKIRLQRIVRETLKFKYITPVFRRPLDDRWQPRRWVVEKLLTLNIPKNYIFADDKLKPFRSYYKDRAALFTNYDALYFHWIRDHHAKELRLWKLEKAKLEAQLQELQR